MPPPGERKGAGWPAGRKAGTALSWRTASRRAGAVWCATREEEGDVHQLRASHWECSEQYHHRISRRPTDKCQQCSDAVCPAVRCPVCRVATDTPAHILLECPYLLGLHTFDLQHVCHGERHSQRRTRPPATRSIRAVGVAWKESSLKYYLTWLKISGDPLLSKIMAT